MITNLIWKYLRKEPHIPCVTFFLLALPFSFSLCLSLSHTQTHTHSNSLSPSNSLSLTLSLTHTHSHSHTLSLSPSVSSLQAVASIYDDFQEHISIPKLAKALYELANTHPYQSEKNGTTQNDDENDEDGHHKNIENDDDEVSFPQFSIIFRIVGLHD